MKNNILNTNSSFSGYNHTDYQDVHKTLTSENYAELISMREDLYCSYVGIQDLIDMDAAFMIVDAIKETLLKNCLQTNKKIIYNYTNVRHCVDYVVVCLKFVFGDSKEMDNYIFGTFNSKKGDYNFPHIMEAVKLSK